MPQSRRPLRIGLIADTHGLLRPEALERLRGCDQLIHAGDIGKPEILAELERLAPLSVVRGNNDTQDWAVDIPERLLLKIAPPLPARRSRSACWKWRGRRSRRS